MPFKNFWKGLIGDYDINYSLFEMLGKNLVYRETLRDDPLYYKGRMPVSTAFQLLTTAKRILKQSNKLKVPYILYHGSADQIVMEKC